MTAPSNTSTLKSKNENNKNSEILNKENQNTDQEPAKVDQKNPKSTKEMNAKTTENSGEETLVEGKESEKDLLNKEEGSAETKGKVSTTSKVIVGYVSNLKGSFRAEQADGQVRELQENDPIYEGDAVYHNEEKQGSENSVELPDLLIQMNSGKEVSVTDASYLLFDSTVIGEDKDFAEVETTKREENRIEEAKRFADEGDSRPIAIASEEVQESAPIAIAVEAVEATQVEIEEAKLDDEIANIEEDLEVEIEFVPVNNPPTAFSSTIIVDEASEDTNLTLALPFDEDGDLVIVTITEIPKLGTIHLKDGTIVVKGQIVTAKDITEMTYDAPQDYNVSDEVGELNYTVSDGKETVNGSTQIEVIPVNDAPQIGGGVGIEFINTFTEGDLNSVGISVHIVDDQFVVEDVDNSLIQSAIVTLTNAQTGDLIDVSGISGSISTNTHTITDG
ncbi:cadherin-like domain-containing protein, partial [bacterium]|nr:cadherin-like domain-containing protein [bacterium]